jgi:hypothetical protein
MFDRKEWTKDWHRKHPEKRKEYSTRYKQKNANKVSSYMSNYRKLHLDSLKVYNAKYHNDHRDALLAKSKLHGQNQRRLVLEHYGEGIIECACCGESNIKFLTLDHVNNDGYLHRKQLKLTGHKILRWIIKNEFPKGFQVLCMNCNFGKRMNNGICPHKEA